LAVWRLKPSEYAFPVDHLLHALEPGPLVSTNRERHLRGDEIMNIMSARSSSAIFGPLGRPAPDGVAGRMREPARVLSQARKR